MRREWDEEVVVATQSGDLLCCFGRSAHVRAIEKGHAPGVDGLKAANVEVLRTIRGELDTRRRDWDVSPELIARAERGAVDDDRFIEAVRRSLPYAWAVMSRVADRLRAARPGDRAFADDATTPPSEAERGQLLRALASTSIREAAERHFQVRFAFQNCHRVAAFPRTGAEAEYREFTSTRAQILNQTPALRHC